MVTVAPARASSALGVTISQLQEAYAAGSSTVVDVVSRVLEAVAGRGDDGTWITVGSSEALLERARFLDAAQPRARQLPLFGIPFGVKDSIDVAGYPTTLACPEYAYEPAETAPVVQRLLDAGAVMIGKTNLDQFATGLNGTRTPYAVPRSVFGCDLICGGSSSGSALAVALGQVPFTVATDTAGSGRVPPALNGVVGYKPSRGLVSTVGLVPACRSLDCVSLITRTTADAAYVFDVVAAVDEADPWSRPRGRTTTDLETIRVGLPAMAELEFFGDRAMAAAHAEVRSRIAAELRVVTPPLQPFLDAGALLYTGPWVAERLAEFGDFIADHPGAVLPVVEAIITGGARFTAVDVFRAQYRLAALKAEVARLFTTMDVLVLPTIGTTFTAPEVLADPINTNTTLGHYTHFANLLDLCAVAVPSGTTADGRPAGAMVLGPALADDTVLAVAGRIARPVPYPPAA